MSAPDGNRPATGAAVAPAAQSRLRPVATETVRSLARLRAMLARRSAAATLLGALAAVLALFAAAALAARLGAFRQLGWGPLAVWVAGAGCVGWALGRVARAGWLPERESLRRTAALVESELALRRGAFLGVLDAAPPAGTSPALLAAAARRLAARLPDAAGAAWAPATAGRLGRRALARGAALVAAGLAAVAAFAYAGDAAAELASPVRAFAASLAARIEIAASPPAVRKGGAVVVRVRWSSPEVPTLHVRELGDTWRQRPLTPPSDAPGAGRASARLSGIEAPLYVFATAGRAVSETLHIRVIEPPFLTAFEVTARFPAYLERPDETLPADSGTVALPVGTTLLIRGAASTPVASAALDDGRTRVPLAVGAVALAAGRDRAGGATTAAKTGRPLSGATFGGDLVVRGSAAWRLSLRDASGAPFPGPLPVLDVAAVPDSAPVVTLPVPGADTTAPLDLQLPLVVDARDDHALGYVEIVSWRVSRLGTVGARVVDTVPGVAGADHVVQSLVLDLNGRGLLPGDTLRLFARALDRAPTPHVGTTREYAIRLRSMEELREAVRRSLDTLAGQAADLAGDQTALDRRTEDLAAQRLGGGGGGDTAGATPRAADQPAGGRERTPSATLPFEQSQEAARIREEQQRLVERAQALREQLSRVAQAAREAGLDDPAWQQRLQELDRLLQEAITPEMAAQLDQLRQALQRLDPQAVQEALRRLAERQRELREQLERSRELFERAALEGSMQTFAQNAAALSRAESLWAARAGGRGDTAAALEEQRELRRRADTLQGALERFGPRLAQRADSQSAAAVNRAAQRVAAGSQRMADATTAMQAERRSDAQRHAEEAADSLRSAADSLAQRQGQMSAGWRAEVLKLLHDAMDETITLSAEEQGVADRLRAGEGTGDVSGRQSALEQGVDQITRRLARASGENALVSPQLGAALGAAKQQIDQSRRSVDGPRPDPGQAADQAEGAARALAAAAFQIMRAGETVAGSQSGSGVAEALQRLAQLAHEQGALSAQLGGLLPLLGPGAVGDAVLRQLREIAARQRSLADQLDRLSGQGLPGRTEELAREARQLADRLEQGQLDRQTLERQQRLFHRMLDAGRTLQDQRETEQQRVSETAREHEAHLPVGTVPREAALRYPVPRWDQLKSLTPAERAMVLDYFRRINAR